MPNKQFDEPRRIAAAVLVESAANLLVQWRITTNMDGDVVCLKCDASLALDSDFFTLASLVKALADHIPNCNK